MDEIDVPIQLWQENPQRGGWNGRYNNGRARGWGGSGSSTPRSGFNSPRSRGSSTPRGRGRGSYDNRPMFDSPGRGRGNDTVYDRGRGRGGRGLSAKLRAGAPLSRILHEDRPLLRPITFVRSVHTAILFEKEEDILQPTIEETGDDEASHVPTADRVARVFGVADDDDDDLEEIDFADIGRLQAEVDAAVQVSLPMAASVTGTNPGFFIDTAPGSASTSQLNNSKPLTQALGEDEEDDDEVIVYVAPHPRAGPVTPPKEQFDPLPSYSILTGHKLEPAKPPEPSTANIGVTTLAAVSEEITTIGTASVQPIDHPVTQDQAMLIDTNAQLIMALEEFTTPESSTLVRAEPEPATILLSAHHAIESVVPNGEQLHATMEPQPTPILENQTSVAILSNQDTTTVETTVITTAATEAVVPSQPTVSEQPSQASDTPQPIPSVSRETPPAPPTFDSVSFSFSTTPHKKQTRRAHPVRSPKSLVRRGRPLRKPRHFASFGAALSEAHLWEEEGGKDPRESEQRRGDSDVDWGDESDEGEDDVKDMLEGIGKMDLDEGEGMDVEAMKRFVQGMSVEGQQFVTMDDVADTERMRVEDEEDEDGEGSDEDGIDEDEDDDESEDDEIEAIFKKQENLLVGDGSEEESSEDDEDDDGTPDGGFQARLKRLRENAKGKQKATNADRNEEFIAEIEDFLDEHGGILAGKDRKERNKLFRAIRDGDWDYDDYEEMVGKPAKRKKDKRNDLPLELQAQWDKDREKKAENKRKRALAKLEAAADPLSPKKGGKKGMKATLAAARLAANGEDPLPHQVVDLVSLEKEIRRFIADIGGKTSMVLPPADKATRKRIHELAAAFNLKSQSKGKGNERYTSLIKKTKTGAVGVNEKKIRRVMREAGIFGWESSGPHKHTKGVSLAKHQEGEEVGKAAPKISESNVGFKMLAAMGWAEGERIGLSGGLAAPLVAVMKKTKLGLGATM